MMMFWRICSCLLTLVLSILILVQILVLICGSCTQTGQMKVVVCLCKCDVGWSFKPYSGTRTVSACTVSSGDSTVYSTSAAFQCLFNNLHYVINIMITTLLHIFSSWLLGRPFDRVDLIKPVSNVRLSTKSFFDFNEIQRVGRGQRVMHDGMQYDPIQGQGHKPFKVGNPVVFKSYLLRHLQWELATDHGFLN